MSTPEMVERVARAIIRSFNTMPVFPSGAGSVAFSVSIYHRVAEAAILAMREPTKEMIEAVHTKASAQVPEITWPAMIDAAFNPNTPADPDEHDEIAVTPEMIEAGVDAYFDCEWRRGDEERVVAEVYKAMYKVMHRAQKG